jgi:hypothetical protein
MFEVKSNVLFDVTGAITKINPYGWKLYSTTQMSMVSKFGIKFPHIEDLTFHGFDI